MVKFRLSGPARRDVANILLTSLARWGVEGRRRYAELVASAMRMVAADPQSAIRSLHLRHAPGEHHVKTPVHILYYRAVRPDLLEIVRVLHERMEPARHLVRRPRKR